MSRFRDEDAEYTAEERDAILEERALRLARRDENEGESSANELCFFSADTQRIAIPSKWVVRAVRSPAIRKLPVQPPACLGMANVMGELTTVIDVRPLLALPGSTPCNRLLFIDASAPLAIAATSIEDVMTLEDSAVPIKPKASSNDHSIVESVFQDGTILLDAASLFEHPGVMFRARHTKDRENA
ncbi:MAG: chemotaxis protein CheW [Myxococcota bacterium]